MLHNLFLSHFKIVFTDDVQVANDITWQTTIPFSSQETMPICGKQVPVQEKQVTTLKPVLAQDNEQQPSAPPCLCQENNSPEFSDTGLLLVW